MTTQSLVQARVWRGYGVAAKNLGAPCYWFRCAGNGPVFDTSLLSTEDGTIISPEILTNGQSLNFLGTLMAAFDTDPRFSFRSPSPYGNPKWYGLFDPTLVRVGDYLFDPVNGTFFVASIETLHPPLCISCNRVMTITRPGQASPSAQYYGGVSLEVTLATGWPAAVIASGRGQRGDVVLPGDAHFASVQILLPAIPGVQLLADDFLTDDQAEPQRYIANATELTSLGWRVYARLTGA